MTGIIYPALDRFRSTLRIFGLIKPVAVPAVIVEGYEFFGRVHKEITVIVLTRRGIAVIPLSVDADIVPVMLAVCIGLTLYDHALDAGLGKQGLGGISK